LEFGRGVRNFEKELFVERRRVKSKEQRAEGKEQRAGSQEQGETRKVVLMKL